MIISMFHDGQLSFAQGGLEFDSPVINEGVLISIVY